MTARKAPLAAPTHTLVHFCRCSHLDYIHNDDGTGACTGVLGHYDAAFGGYIEWACPCQHFVAEAQS